MEWLRKLIDKVPTGVLSGIVTALILWLTLAPRPTGDLSIQLFPGADKVIHGLMFGALTFVILLESMKHKGWKLMSLVSIGAVGFIVAAFGIGIEFAQRAMGMGRSLEIMDMLADVAGAMLAAGIWAAIQEWFVKPQDN